ncbi:hypothetical protein KPH14_007293 [Odynerus spinipes]|uniref:TIL domain-containing protein n=1 Tax=Odynerus spinipes TaxID=1348599 RepID=A0AAD9VJE9_9HYME|nr:hypothetical protein KPH14_007293 [Odynerus spinipes]
MARVSSVSFVFLSIFILGIVSVNSLRLYCNRPNEEYQCGSACQTTCENLGKPCPIINIKCNDACYCKEGYARDKCGNCIPISKCPKKHN